MDIFDRIAPEKADLFDELESDDSSVETIKSQLSDLLNKFDAKDRTMKTRQMTDEVKSLIREEIAKIKPVQNVIERTLEKQVVKNIHIPVHIPAPPAPPAPPPQKIKEIIREVRIEAPKDPKKYAEEQFVDILKKQIGDLQDELQRVRETLPFLHGGPGVIGIPAPEGNENKVLTVKSGKATWQTSTGGGGGTSPDAYTPTNVTTTQSFNATSTTLDTIANVLGSLIASLQGAGIIQ